VLVQVSRGSIRESDSKARLELNHFIELLDSAIELRFDQIYRALLTKNAGTVEAINRDMIINARSRDRYGALLISRFMGSQRPNLLRRITSSKGFLGSSYLAA